MKEMKEIKKISPPHGRMGQEDCPYCDECRKSGSNFCGRCGKQLKEHPIILDYTSSEK